MDVKKNQRDTKKETKKGKEPVLDLHNEIEIITSREEVIALWSELILKYLQGDLVDPKTCEKMKLNSRWIPQKDGIMNREFFKWLGNCNKEDHCKLCLHLLHCLGPKRILKYPKVTIKQTSKVLKDCYSAREWLEQRKRKALVKKELHKLYPSLKLMDGGRCLQEDCWKQFKVDYNVTRASMCVLLEAPGEDYFVTTKLIANKNKAIEELLPYAKQFFKAFLSQKANFVKFAGRAYFREYDALNNRMGLWPVNSWCA